jgi:hypothetical protein
MLARLIKRDEGYRDATGAYVVRPAPEGFGCWEVAPVCGQHETPDYDAFFWCDTLYQARLHIQRCLEAC